MGLKDRLAKHPPLVPDLMNAESPSVPKEDRPTCTATAKSTGKRCGKFPAPGATVCAKHGGRAPQVKRKARERVELEAARQAVKTFGGPIEVDPHTALIQELHRTAGHVAWLQAKLGDGETDGLVQQEGGGEFTDPYDRPSVWLSMYQAERTHLTRVAKACIDAGIEERRIRLAEAGGRELASFVRGLVDDLGVQDHPGLWDIVRKRMAAMQVLEAGTIEGTVA